MGKAETRARAMYESALERAVFGVVEKAVAEGAEMVRKGLEMQAAAKQLEQNLRHDRYVELAAAASRAMLEMGSATMGREKALEFAREWVTRMYGLDVWKQVTA